MIEPNSSAQATAAPQIDAITLEVLRNAFQSVAEEMGAVLRNTSFSPNIKERMDASCAIFDAQGELVAQAEHVPVHLGSMLVALKQILARVHATEPQGLESGDVILVNDPFVGGAHLPDITVVGPIYSGERLIGYIANRAHHADVGGMEPGSMPGRSSEIFQEGLVIPPVKLYRRGELARDVMALVLANVRTREERRGDLNAQISALSTGQRRIAEIVARHGESLVVSAFAAVQDYAERRIRRRIAQLPDGVYVASDALDDDGIDPEPVAIELTITIRGDEMVLDFAGSAALRRGNINAVAPMVYSASFYALKTFTDREVPVNGGTFRPIEIRIPEASFLNAQHPAAVCAGNTETTNRVCDVVLRAGALIVPDEVLAGSQGTMNLIGIGGIDPRTNTPYAYIETIAGGQGGRPWGDGTDGVQCNMTNTMNTPVEALELSYPLRVERYEFRRGSGGDGLHRGGLGVERAVRIIGHTARVSLSSERRRFPPYGLHGGADGELGFNLYLDQDGNEHPLPGKTTRALDDREVVIVRTPGGGGWGAPDERSQSARDTDQRDELT
jgi:N-methylhydantoinase B